MPDLNCYFYSSGIVLLSKLDKINSLGNEFSLQFKIPDDIDIMVAVYNAEDGKEVRGAAFRQQIGEVVTVNVALPKPGRYLLRIFKHGEGETVSDSDFTGSWNEILIEKVATFWVKLPKNSFPYLLVNGKLVPMSSEKNDGKFGLSLLIPNGIDRVTLAVAKTFKGSAESLLEFPVQTRN